MLAAPPSKFDRALEQACAVRGLSSRNARVLHCYSNVVYLLPVEGVVARVTTGSPERVCRSQQAVRDLVRRCHIEATAPLKDVEPVAVTESLAVSFWVYYPQDVSSHAPSSSDLARILRSLHRVHDPPADLEPWQPLTSLAVAVSEPAADHLARDDREWLRAEVAKVRAQVAALEYPLGTGVVHGDAWAGNLLLNPAAGVGATALGDWDWICRGPREIDLIPTWHAASRYGRGPQWTRDFVHVYGYDLAGWPGLPVLMRMRDMAQLTGPLRRAADHPRFASALHQRLADLRANNTTSIWTAL